MSTEDVDFTCALEDSAIPATRAGIATRPISSRLPINYSTLSRESGDPVSGPCTGVVQVADREVRAVRVDPVVGRRRNLVARAHHRDGGVHVRVRTLRGSAGRHT